MEDQCQMFVGVLQACRIVSSSGCDGVVFGVHLIVSCGLCGLIVVAALYFGCWTTLQKEMLTVLLLIFFVHLSDGWKVSDCFSSSVHILCDSLPMAVKKPSREEERG